jgi:uncharacterized membrane protein YoaK (UPF0700 family)
MHDRVADLRVADAPPELVVLRDWLLVALTFSTGILEAICYLSFGKVFCSFQSGNLFFLGLIAAGTRPPQGPDPSTVLISLATFAVGAAVAMAILRAFDGDAELNDGQVLHIWPRHVTMALGLSFIVQVTFLAVWMAYSPPERAAFALVGLNAFGMGVQMNAVRLLHVPGVSTTAFTATIISLVSALATRSLNGPAARRLAGVIVAIVVGALVGVLLLRHMRSDAPVLPVVVDAIVLGVATVAMNRSPSSRAFLGADSGQGRSDGLARDREVVDPSQLGPRRSAP